MWHFGSSASVRGVKATSGGTPSTDTGAVSNARDSSLLKDVEAGLNWWQERLRMGKWRVLPRLSVKEAMDDPHHMAEIYPHPGSLTAALVVNKDVDWGQEAIETSSLMRALAHELMHLVESESTLWAAIDSMDEVAEGTLSQGQAAAVSAALHGGLEGFLDRVATLLWEAYGMPYVENGVVQVKGG